MTINTTAFRLIKTAAERIDIERVDLLFDDDVDLEHRHQLTLLHALAQIEAAVHDLRTLAYDLCALPDSNKG